MKNMRSQNHNSKWKQTIMVSTALLVLAGCSTTKNSPANTGNSGTETPPANITSVNTTNTTGSSESASATSDTYYIVTQSDDSTNVRISYPQIHGLKDSKVMSKLNQLLKQAAIPSTNGNGDANQTDAQPSQVDVWYTVLLNRGGILEVMYSSYIYMQGAAHGMPNQWVLLLNTEDGSQYHVQDLFKPGSSYLQTLSDLVRQRDTGHKLDTFGPFTGVKDTDGFYLSGNDLHVFFVPYEWDSFAAGFLDYAVPMSKLSNVINQRGDLEQALSSTDAQAKANDETSNLTTIAQKGYVPIFPYQAIAPDGNGNMLYAWVARANFSTDGSVQKVFFFLNGKYLGTDTLKAHGPVIQIEPVNQATVAITYSTDDNNGLKITYRWNGSKLVPDKDFPSSYTDWSNH